MKKKIGELAIIAVVSFSALFLSTGCSICYSCGKTASKGCSNSFYAGCAGCLTCVKCSGCIECTQGCNDACDEN